MHHDTLIRDWRRLRELLAQQGPVPAARAAANAALWRYWPPRRRFLRELARERQLGRLWDHEHGVETVGEIALTDAGVPRSAADEGNGLYRGIWCDLFRNAMRALVLDHAQFTFVDFGSGKGKALLLASDYPFREIIGVEYARPLHEVAVANIRSYHSASQRCRRLMSVCGDARHYRLPESPVVCFFFNPMATPLLRRVFGQIVAAVAARPRPAYVVYANPRNVDEHRAAFDALASWTPVAAHRTFRIFGSAAATAPGASIDGRY